MDFFFNIEFGRALVTTTTGAFIGALLALLSALGLRSIATRDARRTRKRQTSQLAQLLVTEIEKNREIVQRLGDQTTTTHILGYVDTAVLEARERSVLLGSTGAETPETA